MKTFLALIGFLLAVSLEAAPMKALIIDGQNNHDFRSPPPHLKKVIEETGLFTVEVASTPGQGKDMSSFHPVFGDYQVIISNYNGEPWSQETRDAFEKYVREGGGFVSVHAADNAFPNWKAYNEMIAVGGWRGRNEKAGPMWYWKDGKVVRDPTPGNAGSHVN